jgi:DNA-binding transcriptional regulator YhcF (GntR family)
MYYYADMKRKPITEIIENVKKLLQKEKELSIRQISIKTGSQWRTIAKALELMKSLGIVKERFNDKTDREERLFSLK